jgi:hypothetical protein
VVVLPSVPVMPTTVRSCDGSPNHHAARLAEALRDGEVARPLDDERGGARRHRRRGVVVTVGPGAGDGHEQRAGGDQPRVVGHAGHGRVAERRRPGGPPVEPDAAQATGGGEAIGQLAERPAGRQSAHASIARDVISRASGPPCR